MVGRGGVAKPSDAAGLLDLHWWLIKIVGADGPVLIPTVEICGGLG